jgi:hypothetical protein
MKPNTKMHPKIGIAIQKIWGEKSAYFSYYIFHTSMAMCISKTADIGAIA